jgi:multiple sugar transport system substrate-binding protein
MISDVLQSEFSAVVAGVRTPEAALARAQRAVDRLMGAAAPPPIGIGAAP